MSGARTLVWMVETLALMERLAERDRHPALAEALAVARRAAMAEITRVASGARPAPGEEERDG